MKGERDEREKGLVTEIRRGENTETEEDLRQPNQIKKHTVNYKERKIITHSMLIGQQL